MTIEVVFRSNKGLTDLFVHIGHDGLLPPPRNEAMGSREHFSDEPHGFGFTVNSHHAAHTDTRPERRRDNNKYYQPAHTLTDEYVPHARNQPRQRGGY